MDAKVTFWLRVRVGVADDECWGWVGPTHRFGYGLVGRQLAHRLSWEIHKGATAGKKCVLHSCDNPPCSNPRHLFLGTKTDNVKDMDAKGRRSKTNFPPRYAGETHPSAKLTKAKVADIRARYKSGGVSQPQLGREYDVSHVLIGKIVRYEIWRD